MIISENKLGPVEYLIGIVLAGVIITGLVQGDSLNFLMIIQTIVGFVLCTSFFVWMTKTPLGREVFDPVLKAICFFALVYCFGYITQTTSYYKSSDIFGHYDYIEWLYKGIMPHPSQGWQTYQPPLYYLLATPFYAIAKFIDIPYPFAFVRYLSVICHLVFLLYSAAFLKLTLKNKKLVNLGFILLVVWPMSVVYSAKINNDVLITAMFTAALYYLVKWHKGAHVNNLWVALIIALVSIGVKSSGVMLCGVIGLVVLWRLARKQIIFAQIWPRKSLVITAVIVALCCTAMNFGRTYQHRIATGGEKNFLIGNMTNPDYSKWTAAYIVDDNIKNYLTLDVVTFVKEPFLVLYNSEEGGRRYFWNTAAKSLVLGTGNWYAYQLASFISFIYLLMLLYTASTMCLVWGRNAKDRTNFAAPVLLSVVGLLAQVYMRIVFPVSGFGETRYTFYILPILLAAFMRSAEWHKENNHNRLWYVGIALAALLIVCFVIFIWAQYV